jgi:hypothetical protein
LTEYCFIEQHPNYSVYVRLTENLDVRQVANYLFVSAAILIVAIAMGSTSVAAQQSNCASTRGSCSDHCGVANTNAARLRACVNRCRLLFCQDEPGTTPPLFRPPLFTNPAGITAVPDVPQPSAVQ